MIDRGVGRVAGTGTVRRLAGSLVAILVYLFLLMPLLMILPASFSADLDFRFPPATWSLDTYRALWNDGRLLGSLGLSLQIAALASLLATLIGGAAALGITRRAVPMSSLWEGLFLGPITVPFVVTGLGLLLLHARWGSVGARWAIVAAHVVVSLPFVVRATLASLRMVNPSLEEAAWVHGATPWYAFRTVLLPQMRPGLIAGMLFSFFVSLDEFAVTIFLSSVDTVTLPIRIYQYVALDINPTVVALSSLLVIASAALIMILDRRLHLHRYLEF